MKFWCTIHFYPSLVTLAMAFWVYMGLHCRILYKTERSLALIDMARLCTDAANVRHVDFIPSAVTCTRHVFRWYGCASEVATCWLCPQGYGLAIEG